MFVKVNNNAVINTDHIVWVDGSMVHLDDDTQHNVTKEYVQGFQNALKTVNATEKRIAFGTFK